MAAIVHETLEQKHRTAIIKLTNVLCFSTQGLPGQPGFPVSLIFIPINVTHCTDPKEMVFRCKWYLSYLCRVQQDQRGTWETLALQALD